MKKLLLLLLAPFAAAAQQTEYVCPPCDHPCDTLVFSQPGKCPHCGMTLIDKAALQKQQSLHKTVCFYLQDGVEALDFAGPMEVFSNAGFRVFTVSKHKEPLTSQGILKFIPDYSIEDAPPSDILAFFGGNAGLPSKDTVVTNWVKARTAEYYFSVCTGAFILAEAGLLAGLTATTFHLSINQLKTYPKIKVLSDKRFVDNGQVITTAGISAGIDGALHLVSKILGEDAAARVAENMEYDKWQPGQGLVIRP